MARELLFFVKKRTSNPEQNPVFRLSARPVIVRKREHKFCQRNHTFSARQGFDWKRQVQRQRHNKTLQRKHCAGKLRETQQAIHSKKRRKFSSCGVTNYSTLSRNTPSCWEWTIIQRRESEQVIGRAWAVSEQSLQSSVSVFSDSGLLLWGEIPKRVRSFSSEKSCIELPQITG